jgi:Slime mold cyclic AMP receptor
MDEYIPLSLCSFMSIIGNLIIVYCFFKIKEIRGIYEYQFVLVFTLFDLIGMFSVLIPTFKYSSSDLCKVQGIIIQITGLSSILWTGFIVIAMFYEVVLLKERFSKNFVIPILIIILISTGTAIVPLVFNAYSYLDSWCWIGNNDEDEDYLFRFLLFYGILWIVIILNLGMSFGIFWKSRTEVLYDRVGMKLVDRLKWYPLILFICYSPLTALRIMEGTAEVPHEFNYMACCVYLLIGFLNSIAFLFSDKVRPEFFRHTRKNKSKLISLPLESAFI